MLRSHNILLVSSVISLIVVSACSPRQSVTQAMTHKPNPNVIGSSGEPLYQTSTLSTNSNVPIASQQLAATMSPVANTNNQLPAVDYMATGSINSQAQQKPMAIANYNNGYSAIPSVPAQSQNTYYPKAETAYRIQTGDTIYSIGRKFNVHPGEIIARNNILNPNNLVVGQSFMIPTNGNYTASTQTVNTYTQPTQSVPAFPQNINQIQPSYGTQNYTVQSGDTIYSIGRKFNVNPNYIINKNPNINPSQLQPGQVLNIVSANQAVNKSMTQSTQTIDNKKIDVKPVLTQSTVASNNKTSIMGEKTPVAHQNDDLEKQILSNALMLPVKGSIKENKNLRGILISASDGDAVKASAAGEVIYVGNLNNYGNMVLVRHDNGLVTNYARLKKTFVQKGQKVNKGDLIASAGTSDDFKTSDVLFEVRKGTKAVNPLDYIG